MSAQPAPAAPPTPAGPAGNAPYYSRVVHGLIDMGADIARRVHQQTVAEVEPAPQTVVTFERIARCVRRSVMLARKLDDPAPARPADHAGQHRAASRRRIIREVEDVIQRNAYDDEAEALHGEFLDRLDAPDIDDDIAHRPVADIIADICRDLGLAAPRGTHPWKRRSPADIAALCARAAAPPPEPAARDPAPRSAWLFETPPAPKDPDFGKTPHPPDSC